MIRQYEDHNDILLIIGDILSIVGARAWEELDGISMVALWQNHSVIRYIT